MPGNDIIRSLAMGLDVLALMAESENGVRVKDVARKMEIKPPVAHNILRTLRYKGFAVKYSDSPHYQIGPELHQLALNQARERMFRSVENVMQEIVDRIPDATVTFCQPVAGDVMVRRRLSADRHGVMQRPSGYTLTLYGSASGLALLAFCSEECYLSLQQRHPLLDEASNLWYPPEKLDEYLERVRSQGYALHPCGDEKRLAVAAPVRGPGESLTGIIGICRTAGRNGRFDDSDLEQSVGVLLDSVDQVSHSHGV